MIKRNEKSNKISLLEFFIPLYYVIAQYQIGGISLGIISLMFLIVIELYKGTSILLYKPMIWLVLFMFVHDILKAIVLTKLSMFSVNTWIERFVFILFILICAGKINEDNLFRVWKIIGIFAMIGLLYQSFQVYGLHQSVQMIKVLPFSSESISFTNSYLRPRSFFLEPAAYVTWILPLLYLALKRRKIIFSVFITITILLSTSTTGLLMSLFLWVYFVVFTKETTLWKKICVATIGIVFIVITLNIPIFQMTISKFESTDFTSNIRITSGFEIYRDMDVMYQIFGIPYGSTEEFFKSGDIVLSNYNMVSTAHWLGFVNALARALLMYGIAGGILYLNVFVQLYRKGNRDLYAYLFICLFSILGQSVFFNPFFVMQFSILLGTNQFQYGIKSIKFKR